MRRKRTAIQGPTKDVGLEANLKDIVDSVEDELLVVDCDYRVRFVVSRPQRLTAVPDRAIMIPSPGTHSDARSPLTSLPETTVRHSRLLVVVAAVLVVRRTRRRRRS